MLLELVLHDDIAEFLEGLETVAPFALIELLVIAELDVDGLGLLPVRAIELAVLFGALLAADEHLLQEVKLLFLLFFFLCTDGLGDASNKHVFLVGGLGVGGRTLDVVGVLEGILFVLFLCHFEPTGFTTTGVEA